MEVDDSNYIKYLLNLDKHFYIKLLDRIYQEQYRIKIVRYLRRIARNNPTIYTLKYEAGDLVLYNKSNTKKTKKEVEVARLSKLLLCDSWDLDLLDLSPYYWREPSIY
jgi:hypothetical protein